MSKATRERAMNSTRRMSLPEAIPEYHPPSWWRRLIGWNLVGVVIILVAVGLSAASAWQVRSQQRDPNKRIVRLMHWQLELGYRDALQQVMDSYNAMKRAEYEQGKAERQVELQQLAVTEKVYQQVLQTNLIAGTACDIFSPRGDFGVLVQYLQPLDEYIAKPNPYNAPAFTAGSLSDADLARALATLPWAQTFMDGMRGGFNADYQTQYAVPAHFTSAGRLVYNLDLLREISGDERLPASFGELLKLGQQTREWSARTGRTDVAAIAASSYNAGYLQMDLPMVMLQPWRSRVDLNRDDFLADEEGFAALGVGSISFADPVYREYLSAVKRVSELFPRGFRAMTRDGALNLFLLRKAPVFFCASWDAGSVIAQAEGRFRIAFTSTPVPATGEPFGDPPKRVTSEADITAWASYQVNKNGHVAEAIDFLRYWTSFVQNQRFNRAANWIPNVIGTSPAPEMAAFAPRIVGVPGAWIPGHPWQPVAGRTGLVVQGQLLSISSGEASIDQAISTIIATWRDPNYGEARIWKDQYLGWRDGARTTDRNLAVQQVRNLRRSDDPAVQAKVRNLLWNQQPGLNGQALVKLWRESAGAPTATMPQGRPFPEIDR